MIIIIPLDEFNALPLFTVIKRAVGIVMFAIAFWIIDAVVVNCDSVVGINRIAYRHGMCDDAKRIALAEEKKIDCDKEKEKTEKQFDDFFH